MYGATWDGGPVEIYTTRAESPESKSLDLPSANLLSVSHGGDLAISLGWRTVIGWESTGTLARVPLSGGAPREVMENVGDADWSPDGQQLAVIHRIGDRSRLEYPMGTALAEASGWFSHPRLSPDGRTLGYFEHPERGDNAGRLILLDVASKQRTEGPAFGGFSSFAWDRRGDIVMGGRAGGLDRVARSGKSRPLLAVPGGFLPTDIAPNGTLLAQRSNWRREMVGFAAGAAREKNLTWLDWSFPNDLSDDGKTLMFDEQSSGRANYLCYVRKMDGSAAVLLGKAKGFGLSPDGKWALTTNPAADQLTLIPTGAGVPKVLPKAGLTYQWAKFFPDGKRFLLWANEPGHSGRLFIQDADGGKPRPISPDGYALPVGRPIRPDGTSVLAVGPDRSSCSTLSRAASPCSFRASRRKSRPADGPSTADRSTSAGPACRCASKSATSPPAPAASGRRSFRPIPPESCRSGPSWSRRTASPTCTRTGACSTTCSW